MRLPRFVWKWMHAGPLAAYRRGQGARLGEMVLVLTTTGRKSGLPRKTPLQYEDIDGVITIGSARGAQADWYRNILADPRVHVRVSRLAFDCSAEPVTDPARIADFLAYRLKRKPLLIGLIMRLHHLPLRPSRLQLEELARTLAVVRLCPPRDGLEERTS